MRRNMNDKLLLLISFDYTAFAQAASCLQIQRSDTLPAPHPRSNNDENEI